MRLKSKTFLVIGGALCAFGAIFCAIILAIGQFDFMKVISVEKYEDKVYTLPAGALTALNLDAQNQRVVFQPAASSDIVIRYREFASDTYTFEQQGASLNVTYRCDQKWYQSLVQGMFGGIARASQSITVEVPPQYAGLLNARTTNASLTADAVEAPEADFTTQSGSVRLENSRFAARVSVRTTNAGIRVEQLASPDIRLSSTNGSIKGTIAGSQQDYSIVTNTTNGSASPSSVINKQAPGQLNATTSNSSITLTFTGA